MSMFVRYINWLPLALPELGDLACNPGMCPDRESNQQTLGLWYDSQHTEPHQSGLHWKILKVLRREVTKLHLGRFFGLPCMK